MDERRQGDDRRDRAARETPADEAPERPDEHGDPDHRFAADEEVADGAAGADEARTPGMGA